MHGAREAIAGGMLHIEEQVKAIELAVVENAGLTFDLARTLVESTCRSILTEKGIPFEKTDELPKLFKLVSAALPFLPPTYSNEAAVRKSLAMTLGGLHTALQGVCELRNDCGFASHGKDGPRPVLEVMQAILAAQAADAIVGFLHRANRQVVTGPPAPPLTYDENPEFNEAVDDRNSPVLIWFGKGNDAYSLDYEASRLLFDSDIEAYRNELVIFKSQGTADPADHEELA